MKNNVPSDHILINEKWQNNVLGECLHGELKGIFVQNLGEADFVVYNGVCLIYLGKEDVKDDLYKIRIRQFSKENGKDSTVLIERNQNSLREFSAMQDFAVVGFGLTVLPVAGIQELPATLKQLKQHWENKEMNIKKDSNQSVDLPSLQRSLLTQIPGVGPMKAKQLLSKFGTIENICGASKQDLLKCADSTTVDKILLVLKNGQQ